MDAPPRYRVGTILRPGVCLPQQSFAGGKRQAGAAMALPVAASNKCARSRFSRNVTCEPGDGRIPGFTRAVIDAPATVVKIRVSAPNGSTTSTIAGTSPQPGGG